MDTSGTRPALPCCPELPGGDLWVFAYGSLMWDPCFEYLRAEPARVHGYHRAFCVYSTCYRGTPERPGLVLGLDRGGVCRGIAYQIAEAKVERMLHELWDREMQPGVYMPRMVPVNLASEKVSALTFVADREHGFYAGRMDVPEVARTIAARGGARGPNADYLFNTLRHLDAMNIREKRLDALRHAVQALQKPRR